MTGVHIPHLPEPKGLIQILLDPGAECGLKCEMHQADGDISALYRNTDCQEGRNDYQWTKIWYDGQYPYYLLSGKLAYGIHSPA